MITKIKPRERQNMMKLVAISLLDVPSSYKTPFICECSRWSIYCWSYYVLFEESVAFTVQFVAKTGSIMLALKSAIKSSTTCSGISFKLMILLQSYTNLERLAGEYAALMMTNIETIYKVLINGQAFFSTFLAANYKRNGHPKDAVTAVLVVSEILSTIIYSPLEEYCFGMLKTW